MSDLLELADRVEAAKRPSNALDVQIEVALFKPCAAYSAVRPNAAGTKVIYTLTNGNSATCWAPEWTADRPAASASLRAINSIRRTA